MANNSNLKDSSDFHNEYMLSQTMPRPDLRQNSNEKIQGNEYSNAKNYKKSLTETSNKDGLHSNGKGRFNEEPEFIVKKSSGPKSIRTSVSSKVLLMTPPTKITLKRTSSKNANLSKSLYKDQIVDSIK